MKLKFLHESLEDNIKKQLGLAYFKKLEDPNRLSSLDRLNQNQPERSGNQDTPLTPRLRRFFNAPTGATVGKIGFQDNDDAESKHARDSSLDDEKVSSLDYPKDEDELEKEISVRARKEFGYLAVAGAKPHLQL
jgi:hypothetical protein